MNNVPKKMATDKSKPEHWRVTLSNPPINAIDDLPLNFHPAAVRASANVTPLGAVSVPA